MKESKNLEVNQVISDELAVIELRKFVAKYRRRDARKGLLKDEKLLDEYPNVIDAITDGLIIFDDKNHPKYKLREPLMDSVENIEEITFRTRIKPSDQSRLMDGINIQTQTAKYVLRFIGYITGLAQGDIDRLDKEDYDTINQICSVF